MRIKEHFATSRPRASVRVAVVLALILSGVGAAGPAAATGSSISGHVDIGALGVAAVAGEVVVDISYYGTPAVLASVPTDASGDYLFSGLSTANYSVFFRYVGSGAFSSMGWGNKPRGIEPTPISAYGGSVSGMNIVLPVRAALSGVVTLGASGSPAGAGAVLVQYIVQTSPYEIWTGDATWSAPSAGVLTDANGRFTFPELEAGRYNFRLTPQISGYQTTWRGTGPFGPDHAQDFSFPAGAAPAEATMALLPLQTLSGTVYLGGPSQIAGEGDATVALQTKAYAYGVEPTTWTPVATASTTAEGTYSFNGLTNSGYRLVVTYNRGGSFRTAYVEYDYGFRLGAWSGVTIKDATLPPGYSISGHVDLATAGNSAGAGEVEVWVQRGLCCYPSIGPFPTDSDGNYAATGLAGGYYTVRFAYVGLGFYMDAVHPGDGNATFPSYVRLNADTSGIDAVLPEAPGVINVTVQANGLTLDDFAITGALTVDLLKYDEGIYDWSAVDSRATTSPSTVTSFSTLGPGYYYVTVTYDGPKGFDSSSSPIFEVTPGSVDEWTAEISPSNSMQCAAGAGPLACRIGGATRFNVSAGISELGFDPGVPVVYVANGLNYPDALSAAPAASLQGGPLLLVTPTGIPAPILAEITRLHPAKIVVVGGPGSVSPAVFTQLSALAPEIVRLGGIDRYAASRAVAEYAFGGTGGPGATVAYITTGRNFPDALSAGGAAALQFAPVITVDGSAQQLDVETRQLLIDLGVTLVKIAGGPGSVSQELMESIDSVPGIDVERLWGEDRYSASGAINRDAFTTADVVFLSVGTNYPDALSGGAVAGAFGSPIYVIPKTCIPSYVLDDIRSFGATTVIVLGGPGSVADSVLDYAEC